LPRHEKIRGGGNMSSGRPAGRPLTHSSRDAISLYLVEGF